MSIKLLPASVNPFGPSEAPDGSASLVSQTPRAISTRAGQISLVPSSDTFAWSSSTRREGTNRINATFVENSENDETGHSGGGEYVSGWGWGSPLESTAVAHYLFYAGVPSGWRGQLIDLYA
jgi:hypothetical protein